MSQILLTNNTTVPVTPGTGLISLYSKASDKRLYYKDDTGVEIGPIDTGAVVSLTADVSGILPIANGGTASATATGSGSAVLATSPTLVTPVLGVATGTSFNTITGVASKANQVAATSGVLVVTPLHQQDHPSAAKGWVFFGGVTTISIGASYNVASVTRASLANYTVNWDIDFSSSNYAVIVQGNDNGSGNGGFALLETVAATGVSFVTVNTTNLSQQDASKVSVLAFGAQ